MFHRDHPELMTSLGVQCPPLGGGHCQEPGSVSARRAPVRMRTGRALRRTPVRGLMVRRARVHGGPRVRAVARAGAQ